MNAAAARKTAIARLLCWALGRPSAVCRRACAVAWTGLGVCPCSAGRSAAVPSGVGLLQLEARAKSRRNHAIDRGTVHGPLTSAHEKFLSRTEPKNAVTRGELRCMHVSCLVRSRARFSETCATRGTVCFAPRAALV